MSSKFLIGGRGSESLNGNFISLGCPLPYFVSDLLDAPPDAGDGVHAWIFRVARYLHPFLPAEMIVTLLESRVADCGRVVPLREIEAAVRDSGSCAWTPGKKLTSGQVAAPKWPLVSDEQRAAVIRDNGGLADLWELSSPLIVDDGIHTEDIIDRLYPGNPLLCCGRFNYSFDTRPREDWRGELSGLQLIVPSPMSAVTGLTKDGRESKHTLDNTGPRRFLICEFDSGSADEHAAVLLHLGTFAPLVLAVHSGGKSLHGWFFVAGQPAQIIESFFRYAVSLGADPATWTRSQFVRMPDGTRDTGVRQTVFFTNFKPMEPKL